MYIATLAEAAFRLWPVWYTDLDFSRFDRSSLGLHGIDAAIRNMAAEKSAVSALWAQRAAAHVLNNTVPILPAFSAADQLRQLGLAIHRHGLALIIELADQRAAPERLRGFASSTQWLARYGSLSVVVLLPRSLAQNPGLDALLYDALHLVARAGDAETGEFQSPDTTAVCPDPKSAKEYAKWLWPLIGRPHPFSPAEQLLAATLSEHTDLAPLFAFNQPVEAAAGTRYVVDLLWKEGRVIVEIDGYRFHSDEAAFASDRHRDYELTLSGYLVFRLPHSEVMANVSGAVAKISDMVKFRRDSQMVRN